MIEKTDLVTLFGAWQQLPEFSPPSIAEIKKRCSKNYLALVDYQQDEIAGFKLGYAINREQFYSWVGGVKPCFRGKGIAKTMLAYQENWCRQNGFQQIMVKSMNQFRPMLHMLIANDYQITDVENANQPEKTKIHFCKTLR